MDEPQNALKSDSAKEVRPKDPQYMIPYIKHSKNTVGTQGQLVAAGGKKTN